MVAISESDDVAVGRLIQTALRNNAGPKTIISRIVEAHKGLFHPRNYSQKSFDLAVLVHKIGGPRLLFALAEAMSLPSLSTIYRRVNLPYLSPSVGFPTRDEVLANIHSLFGSQSTRSDAPRQFGLSLMIDKIAIEPRLRYSMKPDAVLGVCREHAHRADLISMSARADPVDTLLRIKECLDTGQCHRAAEATMVSIAKFGRYDYGASIVGASSTCKKEKAAEQADFIRLYLQSWQESPDGECKHGPILSASTDGDAGRRVALFKLCMSSCITPSSKLYPTIGHLPLFNLNCGPTEITHDGDYKHEEKRLASALRSRSGILVNGAHISPNMLVQYLKQIDDLSKQRILAFFDGTDPQNVPKANALLMHLYRASQLSHIRSSSEHKSFVLLGELLGSFVHPYSTPTMSLREQLVSLAKCGHLLFALYRADGPKFLPGQLIYDMQTSIKNAVFCVAKTQVFDPSLPFYLLQTGTDRLESRFGTLRTTSSDRNGDILQMCERASSAQCIDEIFSKHPNWNRAPYRLSLDGRSGIDHTNPASWTGDVIVGHVDLYSTWIEGRTQAAAILKQAGVSFEFDPIKLQMESPNIDLMRPNGAYPGIHVDYSEPELQPLPVSELEVQAYPSHDPTTPGSHTVAAL
ncbi:hypothetical protein FRC11_010563 [Ceratobasidium sp. 423]|nr:hypothetical protein FRC11_010563 [Ceratobasidium sp. 423]